MARDFAPDLVLFPGDFTNLSFVGDPVAAAGARRVLEELCQLAPVFVSRGTPEVDPSWWVEEIVRDTAAVWLDNNAVGIKVAGCDLHLIGIPYEGPESEREAALSRLLTAAADCPVILLHHTPDLAETAAEQGVWLYVAGHTHGGQIRAPWWGPLFPAARYGRKYAFGVHHIKNMTLVVSQGLGLEGAGAPRLRFLSPPEVVGIIVAHATNLDNPLLKE
jgi:hypothetical protein